MTGIMHGLWDNRAWLFSGLGVFMLGGAIRLMWGRRKQEQAGTQISHGPRSPNVKGSHQHVHIQ